jgi:hypothetical protein
MRSLVGFLDPAGGALGRVQSPHSTWDFGWGVSLCDLAHHPLDFPFSR